MLSGLLTMASRGAVRLCLQALQDMPTMRQNCRIPEEAPLLRVVLHELFVRYRGLHEPRVVAVLVFKGRQELDEIRAW